MKFLRSLIVPISMLVLVASVAHGALYQWSKTAATNATADPSINWAEGMAPSAVNDSARSMMARMAEYRDDISGALTTGGIATAYTLTTNQGLTATPVTGQLIAFVPNVTNGVAPTLVTDGGNSYPIQQQSGVAVASGTLVQGTPYTASFNGSAWMLRNFYGNPFAVPIGSLLPYTGATSPNSNFILPYGQCISRTTYAAYFALVATAFGGCDGTTTFAAPDMRGRIIAGLDNIGGSAASRLTSTYFGSDPTVMGNTGGSQSHTVSVAETPSHTHTASVTDPGHTHIETAGTPNAGGVSADWVQRFQGTNSTVVENISSNPTVSSTTGITVSLSSVGGGSAMPIVPPAMVLQYILRIN